LAEKVKAESEEETGIIIRTGLIRYWSHYSLFDVGFGRFSFRHGYDATKITPLPEPNKKMGFSVKLKLNFLQLSHGVGALLQLT
jgi:hypothetical protein